MKKFFMKIIYLILRKKRQKNKLIKMSDHRKIGVSKQPCSYCKKRVDRISFYADGHGKVIGLCNICKPHAERQSLMRL